MNATQQPQHPAFLKNLMMSHISSKKALRDIGELTAKNQWVYKQMKSWHNQIECRLLNLVPENFLTDNIGPYSAIRK